MPATNYPNDNEFGHFPLWEYYADPDDVPGTLPNTSRPPIANTQSGTPNTQRPVDNLDRPLVHAEPDLAQINTELDRWGNNVHQWASSTFPRKLDGIAGGKVTATCAPDGSLVFDAGLPRYPHCTIIQPRDPVNFLRAYILPEEERHNTVASGGLTLGPSTIVVRIMLWDYTDFDPAIIDGVDEVPPASTIGIRTPYENERVVFDWWAWYGRPASGYGFAPPYSPPSQG